MFVHAFMISEMVSCLRLFYTCLLEILSNPSSLQLSISASYCINRLLYAITFVAIRI